MKSKNLALILLPLLLVAIASCSPKNPPQPVLTISITPSAPAIDTVAATPVLMPSATAMPLPTIQENCTDSALYISDVTIPDNTRLKPGESFTKTWRLRNTGTCIWNIRYALIFVGSEQMSAPITTPLTETAPGDTLDISVNLVAPSKDGAYTGLYELRNPKGRALAIGSVTSIWVKILVGNAQAAPAFVPDASQAVGISGAGLVATPQPNTPCTPQQNPGFVEQVLALINGARAQANLPLLNANSQLTMAAQSHSDDMACNNFAAHTGSDGSGIHARVVAAGYNPFYSEEIIFPGGAPQDAFNWWINDKIHRDALLNPKAVDAGVGYAYVPGSAYGSYITVDFAAP